MKSAIDPGMSLSGQPAWPADAADASLAIAALRRSRIEPGDHVAVLGLSRTGLAALRIAQHLGAGRVDCIDADGDLRGTAAALGATITDTPVAYAAWAKDNATRLPRRVLIFAPSPGAIELAVNVAGKRAVIVIVAPAALEQVTIPDYYLNMIMKEIAIIGVTAPTATEIDEAAMLTRSARKA